MLGDIYSGTKQALVKLEERQVNFVDIKVLLKYEILHDDVELATMCKCKACSTDEVSGFLQIQLKRYGKGQCGGF